MIYMRIRREFFESSVYGPAAEIFAILEKKYNSNYVLFLFPRHNPFVFIILKLSVTASEP